MTSFDVIRRLKRLFPRTKIGHTGTLDPMARGVLPVAIGEATRIIEYLENDDKVYRAAMVLGGTSDTQDAWGTIQYKQDLKEVYPEQIAQVLRSFTGPIWQVPPMYSALHYQGERLYELARKGVEVEREARPVEIKKLDFLGQAMDEEGHQVLYLEVECSKGTYIRTLCHDIGQSLGTGAYMSDLIRVRSGGFDLSHSHSLDEIFNAEDPKALLLSIDHPIGHFKRLDVRNAVESARLRNGNRIAISEPSLEGMLRIYDGDRLLAIARPVIIDGDSFIQPVKVFGNT